VRREVYRLVHRPLPDLTLFFRIDDSAGITNKLFGSRPFAPKPLGYTGGKGSTVRDTGIIVKSDDGHTDNIGVICLHGGLAAQIHS